MIRHHILAFIRSLRRRKLFSVIILLGLTVSTSAALLIYLFVRHELSYDRFHPDAERIYRINQTFIWGDNTDHEFASTGPGVAWAVNQEIPEVELITSIHTPPPYIASYATPTGEILAFEESRILAADSNFFRMFNFPVIDGEAIKALRHPNTIVMTESTARKYFGDDNAVGKLIRMTNARGKDPETFEVTAVVKDTPENSYIEFDALISLRSFPIEQFYWSWIWTQLETYVKLDEGADINTVRSRLKDIPRKHAEQTLQMVMNTTFDDYIKSGKRWDLFLQPLTSIHLPEKPVYNRLNDSGNRKTVYSLAGACVAILLLACVNFMNLSTAQFTRRIKEASIRKVLGQNRVQLAMGYFAEALGFCAIALLAAISLTQLLLPVFNVMTGQNITMNVLSDPNLIIALGITLLTMALLSAAYPSWFLNNFNPAEAVKGKIKAGSEGKTFRDTLVVFQFALSTILMIATVVVFQQLRYVSEKDLGFEKENLLVIKHTEHLTDDESLAHDILQVGGVDMVSRCSSVPPAIFGGDKFTAEGMNGESFSLNYTSGDENYIPALGLKLLVGRNFHPNSKADSARVILNETAVKRLGWTLDESIVGKKIFFPAAPSLPFEVIGVVGDFNYWSLQAPIEPMALFHLNNNYVYPGEQRWLALRVHGRTSADWETTIAALEARWQKHAGDIPFEYSFVDDTFDHAFQTGRRLASVLTILAALAMLIAGLGLLGMITYALEQRTKEICIRKIAGASLPGILFLILSSYSRLLLIAFVIAAPVGWWLMDLWLQDFAYRISPSVAVYIGAGLITFVIAALVTVYHASKVARINPVDVLRSE